MRKLPVVLAALWPMFASAADGPGLAFPEQKIGVPPLSLGAMAQPSPLAMMNDARAWFGGKIPSVVSEQRLVSRMPILSVKSNLDSKMVKAPDLSIDYKLIVKAPNVESAK